MAKTKISEFSTTPGNNTDINGINIAEGCAPSGINNAIRELMSDLKEWQSGAMDVYVIPQGTAAAPGIQLYGDLDTGLYGYAANQLGVAVGGASAGYFSSAGWVGNVNGTITGDINATTIDTTNLEVTNIKAKDGTAAITIADSTGVVSVSTQLAVDNLNLSGNTLSSSDTNGNIILAPNGTGDVQVDADTLRVGDSNANAIITTNGTGDLTLNTNGGTNSGAITIEDGVNGNINIVPNGTGGVYLDNTAGTSLFVRNTTSSASGSSFVAFQNKDGAGNYRTVARASGLTTSNGGNGSFVVETAFSNVLYKGLLINSESDVFFYDSNGNQALKWDSSDKYLGINQTSPTAALDVVGDVKVSGTVNAATIDLTNIEVTNIKAKDGSASATIADSTGVMTIASSVLTTTDINGGTIDGTTIGGSTAAAGTFTTATATTGNITTVNATTVDTTNIEVTNIKAKDGTAALSIADSTGAVTVATALTANGGAVFNENGADVDFRVEGDTDANLIFADASTDRVGIGTNSPGAKLDVQGASLRLNLQSTSNGQYATWKYVGKTSVGAAVSFEQGINITADNAFEIYDNTNTQNVSRYFSGASGYWQWFTNGTEKLRITSGGQVNIGGNFTSTNNTLQVTGRAAIGYTAQAPTDGLIVAGNVGIGTDTVGQKLTVVGTANDTAQFQNSVSYGTVLQVNATATGGRNWKIHATANGDGVVGGGYFSIIDATANAYRLNIDSSGNLGLGVAPSAWGSPFIAFQVGTGGAALSGRTDTQQVNMSTNWRFGSGANLYIANGFATRYFQESGAHYWSTAPNNTSGANATLTFTQAMTLDASGNLLVGTTSNALGKFAVSGSAAAAYVGATVENTNATGFVAQNFWVGSAGGSGIAAINYAPGVFFAIGPTTNDTTTPIVFRNNNATERARITSGGYFKASNNGTYLSSTGTYHELRTTTDNAEALYVSSASTNGTQYGMVIRTANDQNDATRYFLQSEGGGTIRATIRSNGGLANYSANDVNLASDLRLKNTIEPMRSYYDVFKNINWVTWLYNDQTDDLKNHGVIAQELQELAPEFVCESNAKEAPEGEAPYLGIWEQDFKMAGMSVITELIKKIEKLEAEVAALKGV